MSLAFAYDLHELFATNQRQDRCDPCVARKASVKAVRSKLDVVSSPVLRLQYGM